MGEERTSRLETMLASSLKNFRVNEVDVDVPALQLKQNQLGRTSGLRPVET